MKVEVVKFENSGSVVDLPPIMTKINTDLAKLDKGSFSFSAAIVSGLIDHTVDSLIVKISAKNCVGKSSSPTFKFLINNAEQGPLPEEVPQVIQISQSDTSDSNTQTVRLSRKIKYFYKNCDAATEIITETIKIQVYNQTGTTWEDSNIAVIDGQAKVKDFDISKRYRAEIIGTAVTGTATQPIHVGISLKVPKPFISPQDIIAPFEIHPTQEAIVSVPETAIRCAGECKNLIWQCY